MYSTSGAPRRPQRSAGAATGAYLARPRLGTVRGVYSSRPFTRSPFGAGATPAAEKHRKNKYKKSTALPKMDSYKKRPDPVDTAYREAVGRLKVLLAESYTPVKRTIRDDSGDDTDNQSMLSSRSRHSHHHYHRSSPFISRRYPYYPTPLKPGLANTQLTNTATQPERKENAEKWDEKPNPEMMTFIERQEEYIEQLEREAQFCREELSGLLGKVKEVISENENLHEKQKSNLIKSVFEHLETETETETELYIKTNRSLHSPKKSPKKSRRLEGPSIVFESRISELEAQLTQTKIELRKCQDENENYKKKIADGTIGDLSTFDTYKIQLESLQRDKLNLQETVTKLQVELTQLKERNNDTSHKIKRSLDVVEQAQFEKSQLESEIRRLKDELERQHDKLRDTVHEQTRRISDERAAIERRYSQQIEQLTNELGVQWETASKLQLELEKQRRDDSDVRRDVAQKQAHIDDLKKEIHTKTAALQSDLAASAAEKSALEQQIATLNLANERADRQARQESSRLQAEIQSVRQRLDRADADLLHSRRENLRLSDQVASLEKELNINALLAEDRARKQAGGDTSVAVSEANQAIPALPPPAPAKDREQELSSMIKDMEAKHVATVAELETMINSQNQLMEKLTGECHLLTQKLEDASNRHKEEIRELQTNLDFLNDRLSDQTNRFQPSKKDEQHNLDNNQRTTTHNTDTTKPPNTNEPVNDTPVNNTSRTSNNGSPKNTPSKSPPRETVEDKEKVKGDEKKPEYDENQYAQGYDNYGNYSAEQQQEYSQEYGNEQQYPADPQYSEEYPADQQQYEGQYSEEQYQGEYGNEQYNPQYPEQYAENAENQPYEQYQEEPKK